VVSLLPGVVHRVTSERAHMPLTSKSGITSTDPSILQTISIHNGKKRPWNSGTFVVET
jgi:hypothetical protein